MKDLISSTQFAKRLGVSRQLVAAYIKSGKVKAHRMGHYWYLSSKNLDEWTIDPKKQTHKLKRVKIEKPEAPDPVN